METLLNYKIIVITLVHLVAILIAGFKITKIKNIETFRLSAWTFVISSVCSIILFTLNDPSYLRMLAIIMITLTAMKVIVVGEAQNRGNYQLPFPQWLSFASWFGMRPDVFYQPSLPIKTHGTDLINFGLKRIAIGILFILSALLLLNTMDAASGIVIKWIISLLLLIGLSLILHFGILNISAGLLRWKGIDVKSLFRHPLSSKSLDEFWGRRWNLAFSEMTAIAIYRPLSISTNKGFALVMAFLFSGLLHELAISIPVKAGYGLPMCYFMLHGLLMLVESWLKRNGRPVYQTPWIGKTWTMFWLIAPLPLLFHLPFLKAVVWPLIGLK